QPATTPGVTRKILSQMDGPASGYVTLLVEATIEAGGTVGRHTHPGINRPARSKQAMASKYLPRRPMRVVRPATPSPEFLLPTSWRRESLLRLQPQVDALESKQWCAGRGTFDLMAASARPRRSR